MNVFELEYEVAMHQKKLLKESLMMNSSRSNSIVGNIVKEVVLALSDGLISIGIFLQNLYQPSVEKTVQKYGERIG